MGMVHTNLRKVGGSVMLAVPPTLLPNSEFIYKSNFQFIEYYKS